ncbi:MAG TPA: tRNA (N6-isopentenyl adenosine(37)-C2)-methylthiotransferase MiaB [Ruminococcaceae bacterium]|nr:tRNA (N6-isopentenyl adenosine(37)-C2)-methylthiotransferase MiaB [Oscillospiraceae bacterium]
MIPVLKREKNLSTYFVHSFGCQQNAADSEKISGMLSDMGFEKAESAQIADIIFFNTCAVRENAELRVFGNVGELKKQKRENPNRIIALCGCMTQQEQVAAKIRESYPFVDLVIGTGVLHRIPEFLFEILTEHRRLFESSDGCDSITEGLPVRREDPIKAWLPIMYGCDNFCSYCIVPYVRGHERSREPQDILRECEKLVSDGVVEVMLLGQNVNSYGHDLENPCSFAELLTAVAEVPGIRRVRFMTPHPKDMGTDVLEVIRDHPNIARHIHFPLQSGSNEILRRMNRRYTREQFMERAAEIRAMIPDAAITTDIIAGFPGETSKDVDDTVDVIEKVGFDNAYTFIYSPRKGTPAAAMEQVPKEEVQKGFDRILAAVQESAKKRAGALAGRTMTALAEEVNTQDPQYITCRLSNNIIVHVKGDASMIGHFYDVTLDECRNFYYFGTVLRENERGY